MDDVSEQGNVVTGLAKVYRFQVTRKKVILPLHAVALQIGTRMFQDAREILRRIRASRSASAMAIPQIPEPQAMSRTRRPCLVLPAPSASAVRRAGSALTTWRPFTSFGKKDSA